MSEEDSKNADTFDVVVSFFAHICEQGKQSSCGLGLVTKRSRGVVYPCKGQLAQYSTRTLAHFSGHIVGFGPRLAYLEHSQTLVNYQETPALLLELLLFKLVNHCQGLAQLAGDLFLNLELVVLVGILLLVQLCMTSCSTDRL